MHRSSLGSSIYFIFLLSPFWGGSPGLQASPLFSVTVLGPLGTGASGVSSFNSQGAAVGFYTDGWGNQDAALFTGSRTTLGANSYASGINNSGTVIGYAYSGSTSYITEWLNSHQLSLGIAGYGLAINDAGIIVGGYVSSGNQLHAFTLAPAGGLQDLGTLGGSWSSAYAVNASGQTAGTSTLGDGTSMAFFDNGQSMTALGTLGGANSYGMAIDNAGSIAGTSQDVNGYLRAFVWTAAGMQNLGTLGGANSSATGVNDSDWVIGNSLTSGGDQAGFLWVNGSMADLNSFLPLGSGWDVTAADAIDDAGDILATANIGGSSWAVELVPQYNPVVPAAVPEPSALPLAGTVLLVSLAIASRKVRAAPILEKRMSQREREVESR